MWKIALLVHVLLTPPLSGSLILGVLLTPPLASDLRIWVALAALGGFALSAPVSWFAAKAIAAALDGRR